MAYLSIQNITFGYDKADPVISGFSLTISKGQRLAVKSDSGTGKTTLLRLLLGFEIPQKGSILFEGTPIPDNHYSSIRRSTAWLPQVLNIGDGTVDEVIGRIFEFGRNRGKKPRNETISETLAALHLPASIRQEAFRDLSTGQRQRVGLALCHLLDRPLLLLDEPTSALDRTAKQKAIDLLFADPGRTIISTTHDPFWLDRCGTIIELDNR
ncbi:MAG: ATP-binding cassette domain-containing protein [Balneolaceae bacterium]|nr:ATP-binding cassette domain-containing protein [Balneolaceae bacterium]